MRVRLCLPNKSVSRFHTALCTRKSRAISSSVASHVTVDDDAGDDDDVDDDVDDDDVDDDE